MLDLPILRQSPASVQTRNLIDPRQRWKEAHRQFRESGTDPWLREAAFRAIRNACQGRFIYPVPLDREHAQRSAYRPGKGLATYLWWQKLREAKRGMKAAAIAGDRSRFYALAFGRRVWQ